MSERRLIGCVVASALSLVVLIAPSGASAWAPAASAPIHPGVMTNSPSGQCTSNFIYEGGGNVYIGQAAHCTSTGAATSTDGCIAESLPNGTQVQIGGASQPGVMAYNSWNAMKAAGETNPDVCAYNDIALVQINPADVANVNPSVPGWGGPTGVGDLGGAGSSVYTYGNSSLRGGVTKLSPHQGIVAQVVGNGWSHTVYTVLPGIPGDSGSGFMNATGKAGGVLSTLQILPLVASNGVGDLAREISYMQAHGLGASLVPGTEPFDPSLINAINRS